MDIVGCGLCFLDRGVAPDSKVEASSRVASGSNSLSGSGLAAGSETNGAGPGAEAAGGSDVAAALLRAADELFPSRFISAGTGDTLDERYTESQLREVVMIVGNYTQLSMFQNTLGAQLESGYEGLPGEGR